MILQQNKQTQKRNLDINNQKIKYKNYKDLGTVSPKIKKEIE